MFLEYREYSHEIKEVLIDVFLNSEFGNADLTARPSSTITDPEEADRLRAALCAYCRRDTLAMVEMHRALTRVAFG